MAVHAGAVLEFTRRKRILDYVLQNPGANVREVARNTGTATGTVRHHLSILQRHGHLVARAHGATLRLFENHGKYDATWTEVVLLREAALCELHAWLQDHPASSQKAVVAGMQDRGWLRSTTQHRLKRLVHGGLVIVRLQGRLKIYTATNGVTAAPIESSEVALFPVAYPQ